MDDELKPLKPANKRDGFKKDSFQFKKSTSNTFAGFKPDVSFDTSYSKSKEEDDKTQTSWLDHWLLRAIVIFIFFKLFGVLGGICGLIALFATKSKFGSLVAIVFAAGVSATVWMIAFSMLKS